MSEVRCQGKRLDGVTRCGSVLGELDRGRLVIKRIGLVAIGGRIAVKCRHCGTVRVVDLSPVLDEVAV